MIVASLVLEFSHLLEPMLLMDLPRTTRNTHSFICILRIYRNSLLIELLALEFDRML